MDDNRLITINQAAEILSCSRGKIYGLGRAGMLELKKLGYRSIRVNEQAVRALVNSPALTKSFSTHAAKLVPEAVVEKHRRLRVPEAAAYLGISMDKLYRMRARGGGPRYIKIGQQILYDTRELDAWMTSRTFQSISAEQHQAG